MAKSPDWFPHVVRPGDYTSWLAYRHNTTVDEVTTYSKNADLFKTRPNPDVLCPGDLVWLPSTDPRPSLKLTEGAVNDFTADPPIVRVAIKVCDDAGKPQAGLAFEVKGAVGKDAGTVADDGTVAFDVTVGTRSVDVWLPEIDVIIPVMIGGLDPLVEPSGAYGRLMNLGFYELGSRVEAEEADYRRRAVESFQEARGLKLTGELDADTLRELEKFGGSDGKAA